jgi:hypothetical protein
VELVMSGIVEETAGAFVAARVSAEAFDPKKTKAPMPLIASRWILENQFRALFTFTSWRRTIR